MISNLNCRWYLSERTYPAWLEAVAVEAIEAEDAVATEVATADPTLRGAVGKLFEFIQAFVSVLTRLQIQRWLPGS